MIEFEFTTPYVHESPWEDEADDPDREVDPDRGTAGAAC
jgi:hypothetical protein